MVVERPLDREEKPVYDLSVEATDAGTPPLRAVRTFRLIVTDVNDNAPKFARDRYEAHLLEASEPGTPVLKVTATDLDEGANSAIKYSLLNSTWFTIDETSGLISTQTHVDCEADPAPILVVIATDSGRPPLSSSATVRVTVHDLNDNEPIFEKPLYNATVPEDMPVGRCFLKVRELANYLRTIRRSFTACVASRCVISLSRVTSREIDVRVDIRQMKPLLIDPSSSRTIDARYEAN